MQTNVIIDESQVVGVVIEHNVGSGECGVCVFDIT